MSLRSQSSVAVLRFECAAIRARLVISANRERRAVPGWNAAPGYLCRMTTSTSAPPRGDEPLDPDPDPVVEAYKRDIDRTLLRENLAKSPEERVAALMALQQLAAEARRAGRLARGER